jgi:hypothetical protein
MFLVLCVLEKTQRRDPEYFGLFKEQPRIIAALQSACGVRFLHLFRTVVQDDKKLDSRSVSGMTEVEKYTLTLSPLPSY